MHECLLTKCTICTPYAHHMHHTHSIALAENETFCGIPSGIPICFGTRGQWAMLRFKSKRFFNLSWTRRKLVNRNLNHHKPPKAILQFWTIAWLILSHLRALPALAPQRQFPQNRWASCTGCCLSGPTRGANALGGCAATDQKSQLHVLQRPSLREARAVGQQCASSSRPPRRRRRRKLCTCLPKQEGERDYLLGHF